MKEKLICSILNNTVTSRKIGVMLKIKQEPEELPPEETPNLQSLLCFEEKKFCDSRPGADFYDVTYFNEHKCSTIDQAAQGRDEVARKDSTPKGYFCVATRASIFFSFGNQNKFDSTAFGKE